MPYRSPGCADVLRGARAHVTDFSYMTLMDKSAVKHNMLKGLGPELESLPFAVQEFRQKISCQYEVALGMLIFAVKSATEHLLYSSSVLRFCAILGTTQTAIISFARLLIKLHLMYFIVRDYQ